MAKFKSDKNHKYTQKYPEKNVFVLLNYTTKFFRLKFYVNLWFPKHPKSYIV